MHKSFPAEKGELKLEELKQNEQIQTPKTKKTDEFHLKQITIIALAIFITFCCCILFFFVIYRYNGFTDFWKKLTYILQPVIIGLVVAYLLNPLMKLIDGKLFSLFKGKMKSEKKAKKISRGLAIAGALLFLVGIIVLLIAAIVPSIIQSIQGIISTLPAEVRSLVDWINDIAKGDSQIADIAEEVITQAGNFFENWMKNTLLPQAEVYISSITSGVITGVKFVINILVGLIISVYVMASQEKFAGQAKKIIYAIFKPVRANVVVETVRKSNEIFGGFISGKILDSTIIGIICYIVLLIMKMPYAVLVSVIVGVTNVIPFFGPFIGAVPGFIIIVLANPLQGLYFLIVIFILQQVDGNIIGPTILGDSTGLSPFWVVFAIMVGGGLFGFAGMLLGVPVFAVIYYIIQRVIYHFLRKKKLPEATEQYIELDKVDTRTNELCYFQKEEIDVKKEDQTEENTENKN